MKRCVSPRKAAIISDDTTAQIKIGTTMAASPLDTQYKYATKHVSVEKAQRVGPFAAFDPEDGAWSLSLQQKAILREVCDYMTKNTSFLSDVLIPLIINTDIMMNDQKKTSEKKKRKRKKKNADVAENVADQGPVTPSLRVMDWFVTNFSKSKLVYINGVAIHRLYVDTRRAYACRNFDPFRRNLKLTFDNTDPLSKELRPQLTTTVGQVNFVVWCVEYGIIDYINAHRKEIDENMRAVCRQTREARKACVKNGIDYKRSPLSNDTVSKCHFTSHLPHWTQPCDSAGRNSHSTE